MESRQQGASEQRAGILGDPVLLAWIALGIGLRVAFAARKSWVLDEFHTDYHAQRATLELLLEGLVQDNHPPLSFLLVRLAGLGLAEDQQRPEHARHRDRHVQAPSATFGLPVSSAPGFTYIHDGFTLVPRHLHLRLHHRPPPDRLGLTSRHQQPALAQVYFASSSSPRLRAQLPR